MLLDDGLAEHLLVELCSRWNPDHENIINASGKIQEMKDNISVLMQCAGQKHDKIRKKDAILTLF